MHIGKTRWFWSLLSCVLVTQGLGFAGMHAAWAAEQPPLTVVINRGLPLFTTDVTPMLSGASDAPADARVTVTINDTTYTTTVLPGGSWTLDWPTPLSPGSYQLTVSVADSAGNTGTATQTLTIGGPGRLPRRPLLAAPEQFEPVPLAEPADADFQAVTDRWRIVPPPYEVNVKGSLWDPYNQNVLKGDFPIYGQDLFLNLTGIWDTLVEFRELPTLTGNDSQFFLNQNFVVSADLFKGDTAFKPFDWRVKATLIGNMNYLNVEKTGVVSPDVRKGTDRLDGIPALQEAFAEAKLADLSPNYDFVSLRAGIQPFNSDFKGFVFSDTNLGVRLFGNYEANRDQFNLAYFDRLEKDTNSRLNRLTRRDQRVLIANFYRQDFLLKGYTNQFSVHQLWDDKSFHFDQNGFLARPDRVGSFRPHPHALEATYFGWTSFGHIGRVNIDHALYYVRGHDTKNPIAGRSVDIQAYSGALELSYNRDWFHPKVSYFYASGDGSPTDGTARGFDAIFDNPAFAGGGFSFWNRLGIRLSGTGVNLVNRGSLLPDLRSSKEEGQPNFVNPGLHLFNAGIDTELTPKLKALFNINYLRFDTTESLKLLLSQKRVRNEIGWDLSAGIRYRPFLNNNVILLVGVAVFFPGEGLRDIYGEGSTLFQSFSNVILTF